MCLTPIPLSQTVTLSRIPSPSSVTYFMDCPFVYIICIYIQACLQSRWAEIKVKWDIAWQEARTVPLQYL